MARPSDFEEFRVPVDRLSVEMPGTVGCFYSCHRDTTARQNGWEYSRTVWCQHFVD
jgi:hypothetical protein